MNQLTRNIIRDIIMSECGKIRLSSQHDVTKDSLSFFLSLSNKKFSFEEANLEYTSIRLVDLFNVVNSIETIYCVSLAKLWSIDCHTIRLLDIYETLENHRIPEVRDIQVFHDWYTNTVKEWYGVNTSSTTDHYPLYLKLRVRMSEIVYKSLLKENAIWQK